MNASVAKEQLPGPGQMFLDHIGWMVPSIGVAEAAMEKLGLPLTPYSVHANRNPQTGQLEPVGTGNRLAMLPQGYLEILVPAVNVDNPVTRHMAASLQRYVGVHLTAFGVDDAGREAERIAASGFKLQPTVNLRRTVEATDGREVELKFTVVRPAFEQFAEGRTQVLTHHTPEHMWQERYLPTENPVQGLMEVAYVVDNPVDVASRFSRFLGRTAGSDSSIFIKLDRGRVRFMTRKAAAETFGADKLPENPSIAALTLSTRDLDRTRDVLLSNGLHPGSLGQKHLLIDASEALGVNLVFVPV